MITNERVRRPISDRELYRRWGEVRALLQEKELDMVFTQGSNMHLGGYVRWFTDIPAEYNYNMTVLFPVDDEMTLVRTSAFPIPQWALRGVKEVKYAPFCPSLNYTAGAEIGFVVDYIRSRNPQRVGYIARAFIHTGMMETLQKTFPSVEFVEITDEFDMIKAMKSGEEMEFLWETARIQDAAWSALPAIIKAGMYEYQIRAEVIQLLMDLGSEEHLMFMGTSAPGKPCGMPTFQYANRRMQEGDYGTLLVEVSGPGGYYCESARNFCFGEPYKEMADAWEVAVAGQQLTADLLTDGRNSTEIVKSYNEFVASRGYCQEGRLYGHSQGYDLIERPAFMAYYEHGNETMKIRAGMCCSLHPYLTDDKQTVYINDNYYVTENGAVKMHQTPPEIILL